MMHLTDPEPHKESERQFPLRKDPATLLTFVLSVFSQFTPKSPLAESSCIAEMIFSGEFLGTGSKLTLIPDNLKRHFGFTARLIKIR